MILKSIAAAVLVALASLPAVAQSQAASVTATASITITPAPPPPLAGPFFNPPSPVTVACNAAPGSFVTAISTTGGDSNPVTYTLGTGDTGDFAISGSNLVVGPNGINLNNCGKTNTVQVVATQQ
jgi:hypothetical protein